MTWKKRFTSLLLAAAVFAASVPWQAVMVGAAYDGVLQFDADGKFTVMQLTDIQENSEVEPEIIDLITKAIARYSPDLVVFTGDNIRGFIKSDSFKSAVNQFLDPLLATNTKFAVTFGNHDDQGVWPTNPGTREEQYAYYKSKGGNLFIDHDIPALDGTGSGSIPVYPFGESTEVPAFQIFLMDSGAYINVTLDLDAVKTGQIDYYMATNPTVPSLWFQHIPVPDMYNLLTEVPAGTANSFEGSHDPFNNYTWAMNTSLIDWKASGSTNIADIYKEAPGPTNLDTYQESQHRSSLAYGNKTLYEAWCANGNMKGAFFGHNHTNSFVATTADGITLGYSKAATLQGYNDGDPGCRIFEIDDSGSYTTIGTTLSSLTNYAVGDYTAVNNAISAARVLKNNIAYFRANNINDPAYYNPSSMDIGNGVYSPASFAGEAAILQSAIDSVEHNLDIRSQSLINSFASSVSTAWQSLSLKYADYSSVNQIVSYTNGTEILSPPFYSATHSGQWLPRAYYTGATLSAWDNAINSVIRNLKIPSQVTVNSYASVMQEAYDALRLKPEYEIANIEIFTGSTTVINQATHLIYGLEPGITQDEFESRFVRIYGNACIICTSASDAFGTGTKVELVDNTTGEVIEDYYIVIFGDVNGDGIIGGSDADMIIDIGNYALPQWEPVEDAAFNMAGDVFLDGVIDENDYVVMNNVQNYVQQINQVNGKVLYR